MYTMHYDTTITDTFALRAISLEAGVVGNAVSTIRNFFPRLKQAIMPAFDELDKVKPFISKDDNLYKLTSNEKDIEDFITRVPWEDLSVVHVPTPEGFVGNYVEYARKIFALFDYTQDVSFPAIEAYYTLLGNVLTNKEPKLSTKDITSQYKTLAKDRVNTNTGITANFIKGSTVAEGTMGKLFKSPDEVTELFRLRHKLIDSIKQAPLSKVKNRADKISECLDTIIAQVNENKIDYLSTQQLKNITEGAYEIAAQIEFFAINYYRVEILINTIKLVKERLLENKRKRYSK